LLMTSSFFLPSVLFAAFFSKDDLGQYNLATRILEIPLNLIGYSFQMVYYQRASVDTPDRRLQLYWRALRWMVGVFAPGFFLLAVIAPHLFGLVFGSQWFEAGRLCSWLSPIAAMRLFFTSQCALLFVQRRLNLDLLISFLLFLAQVGGVAIGYYGFHSLQAS